LLRSLADSSLKVPSSSCSTVPSACRERAFFIDNLLVRIHFIIVMVRWTGLAPWEFEFPSPGSLTSTFRLHTRHPFNNHTCIVYIINVWSINKGMDGTCTESITTNLYNVPSPVILQHGAVSPVPFALVSVQGSGFRGSGSGFRVQGFEFRVQGSGFRIQGAGCRVQGFEFRVQGSGFRIQGPGFRV